MSTRPDAASISAVDISRSRYLTAVLPVLAFVNIANLAVILWARNHGRGRAYAWFALDAEGNFPTWFSSALLLGAAAVLAIVAVTAAARSDRWTRHWFGLALVFVALSADETASFHERVGSWLRDRLDLSGVLHYAGIVPALAMFVAVAAIYVAFFRALPRRLQGGILLAAVLYVGGAAGVEAMTGWWVDRHNDEATTGVELVSTVEENLEMAGVIVLSSLLLSELAASSADVKLRFRIR
jgi:hypothetical protein